MGGRARERRLHQLPAVARQGPRAEAPLHRLLPEANEPYDALLDDFEPGMRTEEYAGCSSGSVRPPRSRDGAGEEEAEPFWRGRTPARHSTICPSTSPVRSARLTPSSASIRASIRSACLRDAGRAADDALRGGRSPRQLGLLDHARGRTRGLRARRRPRARPDAALDRMLVGAARVPEPSVGERDRALAAVLAVALSALPGRVPRRAVRRPARAVPSRGQPATAVADPRGRRRDDVRTAHHPSLRARAGAALRRPPDGRPP